MLLRASQVLTFSVYSSILYGKDALGYLRQIMTARAFVRLVGLAALLTSRFSVVVVAITIDKSADCSQALTSCSDDSTCTECASDLSSIFGSTTGDRDCLVGNTDGTPPTICDVYRAMKCCTPNECFANEAFSSYWVCEMERVGCSTEDLSCEETSIAATTVTVGATGLSHLVFATVLVFMLVGMGFWAVHRK